MKLHELGESLPTGPGRKRVGRGTGSGRGKTCGRGTKGQGSRAGSKFHPTFEGGQLPLVKRLPKLRGFKRHGKVTYTPINLDELGAVFPEGTEVTLQVLAEAGFTANVGEPVVVLGRGELPHRLSLHAHRCSRAAREAVQAQGGTVTIEPLGRR